MRKKTGQWLEQKITGSQIWDGFGTDLGDPNIWISGYLGQKSNFGRHPLHPLSLLAAKGRDPVIQISPYPSTLATLFTSELWVAFSPLSTASS
jgi:hypothetical protein